MCLLAFALDAHPRYRLILAANRDEHFARPTAVAGFWDDAPQILAGRDLEAGGTWLGVSKTGRLAALTNYMGPNEHANDKLSRGTLIPEFLSGNVTIDEFQQSLRESGERYNGFGLVFGDADGLGYFTNRGVPMSRIPGGIHGLSNHLLDTPWPKVVFVKESLRRLLQGEEIDPEEIFGILGDPTRHPDHLLPDTGIGLEKERALSAVFVSTKGYGTRSSTVVLVDRENRITFYERTFDGSRRVTGTVEFRLPGHHA